MPKSPASSFHSAALALALSATCFASNAQTLGRGVDLKTLSSNGNTHYLQVIDLALGAGLKMLTGSQTSSPTPTTQYTKQSQTTYWNRVSGDPRVTSLVNGQFFSLYGTASCLSFEVQFEGLLTGGCDLRDTSRLRTLHITQDGASIVDYQNLIPSAAVGQTHLVGYKPGAEPEEAKKPKATNRTVFGVGSRNVVGRYNKLYILSGTGLTESAAVQLLRDQIGSDAEILVMDGGASTFLSTRIQEKGKNGIYTRRDVPQAIAILAARPEAPSGTNEPSINASRVSFVWGEVTAADAFRIQIAVAGTYWTKEDGFTASTSTSSTIPVNSGISGGGSSFFEWRNPPARQRFIWTVRANITGKGASEYSQPRAFTIPDPLPAS